MKFSISLDQRNFLNKNGYVPFYQLLSDAEIQLLKLGINSGLKQDHKSGRDLWRVDESVKKIVFSKRLVDVVFQLTQKKPLRLAFDQYIPEKSAALLDRNEQVPLFNYFGDEPAFQDKSSINSLVGLLLLVLNGDEESSSIGKGGGYFILPQAILSKEDLPFSPNQQFLLIGYADMHSQYLYQPLDPHGHFLKQLGYVFGDKLNDRLHPVLLR